MWMFWSDLHLQSGLVRVTWQPPISAVYCLIITLITPYIYRLSSSSETYSRPRSSSGGLVWWLTVSLEGHTQFWTRHTHLDGISSREEMVLCFHRLRRRLFILLLSKAEPLFSVYFRASTSPIILLFNSWLDRKSSPSHLWFCSFKKDTCRIFVLVQFVCVCGMESSLPKAIKKPRVTDTQRCCRQRQQNLQSRTVCITSPQNSSGTTRGTWQTNLQKVLWWLGLLEKRFPPGMPRFDGSAPSPIHTGASWIGLVPAHPKEARSDWDLGNLTIILGGFTVFRY